MEPRARAAIAWIDVPGDPDGDGYSEYETRSARISLSSTRPTSS